MKQSVISSIIVVGLSAAVSVGCTILEAKDKSAKAAQDVVSGNPNGKDDGLGCATGGDCKSGVCNAGKCEAPTSTDAVRNGTETGLDCGGPNAPKCGGDQACVAPSDCASGACDEGVCGGPKEPPPAPDNLKKDGDETDVDCGGAVAPKCADNLACAAPPDCASGVCTEGRCQVPVGTDGVKNGDESDVDCGGSNTDAPRCGTDLSCGLAEDCLNKVCDPGTKKCSAPTGTDGVQNGDEGDVDCGGTTTGAPKCVVGKTCNVHTDCTSDGCNDKKKCADRRSCTQTNGGATCGAGVGSESCCTELNIPGSGTKLDKFKVTTGRMRAFITRVNGNVLGWYEGNKNGLPASARNQIEPFKGNLPQNMKSSPYGVDYALGGSIYLNDRPSASQGCFVGSAGNQGFGSHTWWNGTLEGDDRGLDQAFLDKLPLNCVTYPLMAAFCAWDGGRLQTFEENSAAYGAGAYPWGNTPQAGTNAGGMIGPATAGFTKASCPGCDPTRLNWTNNWQDPPGGAPGKPWDLAYYISPPGRFPLDRGAGGHMDIAGDLIELTASLGTNDTKYGATVRWSRAGSWEGHGVNFSGFQFAVMTKYGKTGGRCARD